MPGRDLQRTLSRLVYQPTNEGRLLDPTSTPGVPGAVGVGRKTAAGIASPLTEVEPPDREYYEERDLTSSDGLFTIKWQPIKSLTMLDANGREVVLVFADAPPPEPADA